MQKHFNETHGMTGSRFYKIWQDMKARCYYEKDKSYKNYGARGIVVCEKWQKFEGFLEDMFETYQDTLTIDRIDVNGPYCKENCKWSTKQEQLKTGKRDLHFIEYDGQKKTLSDWAKYLGVKRKTLSQRINGYNWSIEKALTTF